MSEVSESNIVNLRVKYGEKNEEKSLDEMITTCDICGKEIIGIENFIDAGDKVVCSENCKQKAYFNDYVEHCEIGLSVDEIMTIKDERNL